MAAGSCRPLPVLGNAVAGSRRGAGGGNRHGQGDGSHHGKEMDGSRPCEEAYS
jgi:hypothetical protein